ncbi:MAG: acyl carrier protein [Rhodobacteraceae bacterium]|nr:acyl carrier protein [Paracoccaceae bacterium]
MKKLETIVADILSVSEDIIHDESNAKNTPNWDSARHIDLMMAVELAYQVQFSMPEITGLQNLGDMRRLLQQKGVEV